ncbi:hypothetical protein ACOSP7_013056 [Xanthoceras sorbifolium]
MVITALTFGLLFMVSHNGLQHDKISMEFKPSVSVGNTTFLAWGRKLLNSGGGTEANSQCSKNDIRITQGTLPPQPSGIPTYVVEITNTCATGCAIGGIFIILHGIRAWFLIQTTFCTKFPSSNFNSFLVFINDEFKP